MKYRMILASASPRRREILSQVGIEYEIQPAEVEENAEADSPQEFVRLLAKKKAEAVEAMLRKEGRLAAAFSVTEPLPIVILGADTVVVQDDKILGKPKDKEDAFAMLSALSGTTHEVDTGVALLVIKPDGTREIRSFTSRTEVEFRHVTREEIMDYLSCEEYADKAGSYAIQGRLAAYIKGISGDYYNVVGLPISEVLYYIKEMLQ